MHVFVDVLMGVEKIPLVGMALCFIPSKFRLLLICVYSCSWVFSIDSTVDLCEYAGSSLFLGAKPCPTCFFGHYVYLTLSEKRLN